MVDQIRKPLATSIAGRNRVGGRLRSRAGTSLDGFKSLGLRVFGLKDALDANVDSASRLFEQAYAFKKYVSDYNGPHDAQLLSELNGLLDDIFNFERQLMEESSVRKAAYMQKHREQIESFRSRLADGQVRYQGHLLMLQRPESKQAKASSSAIPLDELSPILPKYVSIYVGHEEELEGLVTVLLQEDSGHVIILGGGGMGKTALATKGMYDPRVEAKFEDRRFFINCDGLISAEGVLGALSSVFGLTESSPGASLDQILLKHLRSLHISVLIVLDNLESAWDTNDQIAVETLLANLCSVDLISVVVTMRGTSAPEGPVWHQRITLQPLNVQDSYTLFTRLYPESTVPSEDKTLRELLVLLDGLPLALTLVAAVGCTGYTPSELLSSYREEQTAMIKRGRGNDRSLNLDLSISVSLNSQTMRENSGALALLSLLAILPDGLDEKDRIDLFPSMAGYLSATRVLVQVALCSKVGGICRVLAPIRTHLQTHYPASGPHLEELRRFYFRLAVRGREWTKEPATIRNEVGPRLGNIQAVLSHAITTTAPATKALPALIGLSNFCYMAAFGDCKPYLQAGISAYQAIGDAQSEVKHLLAECKARLADVFRLRYDYENATATLKDAKAMFEEIGDRQRAGRCTRTLAHMLQVQEDYDAAEAEALKAKAILLDIGDRHGAAQCTRLLAEIMFTRYDYKGATEALKEAKEMYTDYGSRRGAAQCVQCLGGILFIQDDYVGAASAFEAAKAVFEDVADRRNVAECVESLGWIMQKRCDYDGAATALKEAQSVFDDIGSHFFAAECMRSLGEIMFLRDDYDGAKALVTEAHARSEAAKDRRGAARCRQTLGQIMYAQEDYVGATAALEEAKASFEEKGDLLGAAECTLYLGDLMMMCDDNKGALAAFADAQAVFLKIGSKFGDAQCTQRQGEVFLKRDQVDPALTALEAAKFVFDGVGYRLGAAHCTRALGRVKQKRRDYDGATLFFEDAKAVFEDIGSQVGVAQCLQDHAETLRIRGAHEGAEVALDEANTIFEEVGYIRGTRECRDILSSLLQVRES